MFWFVLLLLLVGGGFYLYQKLVTIEREIRAEQAREKASQQASVAPATASRDDAGRPDAEAQPGEQERQEDREGPAQPRGSDEAAILARVREQPGIVQVELYPLFASVDKKQMQKKIRQLADDGLLRRERQPGGSYRLYPV